MNSAEKQYMQVKFISGVSQKLVIKEDLLYNRVINGDKLGILNRKRWRGGITLFSLPSTLQVFA